MRHLNRAAVCGYSQMNNKGTVIIGGGFSGVACALELLKGGARDITIVEGEERLGLVRCDDGVLVVTIRFREIRDDLPKCRVADFGRQSIGGKQI